MNVYDFSIIFVFLDERVPEDFIQWSGCQPDHICGHCCKAEGGQLRGRRAHCGQGGKEESLQIIQKVSLSLQAIRDGVIEAVLDHESGTMQSKDTSDVYSTRLESIECK